VVNKLWRQLENGHKSFTNNVVVSDVRLKYFNHCNLKIWGGGWGVVLHIAGHMVGRNVKCQGNREFSGCLCGGVRTSRGYCGDHRTTRLAG
jgi:hypothetical protein